MTCACMKFEIHRKADFVISPARGRLADVLTTEITLDKMGKLLYNTNDYKNLGG